MFVSILKAIKELNNDGVWDLIAIIISPIISFAILFFTLRHDKKQFKVQFENQQKEHQENMELMIKQHEQVLAEQMKVDQISIMPYLLINRSIATRVEGNNIYFSISFINKGNGTAIELTGKYLEHLSGSYLCPLFESVNAVYGCACPFDYEKNVVILNEECSFEIYQKLIRDDKSNSFENLDEVIFGVLFKDMYHNQYEQEFMFLFSQNQSNNQIEIHRVATYSPKILK